MAAELLARPDLGSRPDLDSRPDLGARPDPGSRPDLASGTGGCWCEVLATELPEPARWLAVRRVLCSLAGPADPGTDPGTDPGDGRAVGRALPVRVLYDLAASPGPWAEGAGRPDVDRVLAVLVRQGMVALSTIPGREPSATAARWPIGAARAARAAGAAGVAGSATGQGQGRGRGPTGDGDQAVAELVAVASLHSCPQLRGWIAEDADFQAWLARAEAGRLRWRRTGGRQDLLQGSELEAGLGWRRRRGLPREVSAFLAASQQRQQEQRRRQAQRRR